MTDLSSPQVQATFKNNRRTTLITNVIMALLALLTAGLAIWVAVEKTRLKLTNWSVWIFVALLGVIALLFAFIIVWEIFLKKPYRRTVHRFVADNLKGHEELLNRDGDAEFELFLAGDKLTLLRQGGADFAQFDLTPIKRYPTVCMYTASLVKRYLSDYYSLNAQTLGIANVTLTDKVHGRARVKVLLSPEKPAKNLQRSFFVSSGMINKI